MLSFGEFAAGFTSELTTTFTGVGAGAAACAAGFAGAQ